MRKISPKRELDLLRCTYFLFGFGIMGLTPRFPELKANLNLGNGQFGSLLSTGSIGSIISLLTMGHVVHRYGNKIIYFTSVSTIMFCLFVLVHTTSSAVFLLFNIVFGAAISAYVIANQTQTFHLQGRTGKIHLTHLSGMWSAGALASALLAGFLVGKVSLQVHITLLSLIVFSTMLIIFYYLSPEMMAPDLSPDNDYSIRTLIANFHVDKAVAGGLLLACYLEFAIGDWITIFARDTLGFDNGLNTIPFIVFMIAMILGRLAIHRLFDNHAIEKLVTLGAVSAGVGCFAAVAAAMALGREHRNMALLVLLSGMFISGLGSSFIGPIFTNAANARSSAPSSIVMAEIMLINVFLVFVTKWIVAWTAQATNLGIALFIPAVMLLFVPYFAHAVVPKLTK
ncbi:MAG: MFS transporter [Actinobacteria bacterium]|nr:MFS transporter [Actinomycetota bacterium]